MTIPIRTHARRLIGPIAAIALIFGVLVTAPLLHAQEAAVNATVTIVPEGYDVVAERDLLFGLVDFDLGATVDPQEAAAGMWSAGRFGGPQREVEVRFLFPAGHVLRHVVLGGAATLPVDWDGMYALVRSTDRAGREATWNPVAESPFNIVIAGGQGNSPASFGREIEIYLGGHIAPPTDAAAGEYEGTVTLSITDPES